MAHMIDDQNRKLSRNTARIGLSVFLLGVVVPALFAFNQTFSIGLQNSNLFNVSNPNPVEFHTDLVLRATALVLGASTATLAGLALYERKHGIHRISTITFAIVALALLTLNLFVVLALQPA